MTAPPSTSAPPPSCTVQFKPSDKHTEVATGTLLSEAALQAGIDLQLPCGGQGRCGRCAVVVEEGEVQRRSTQRLSDDDVAAGYALACQTTVEGDLVVRIPPQSKIERRLKESKRATKIKLPFRYHIQDQPLRKYTTTLEPPTLQDQTDDWSRLRRELERRYSLNGLRIQLAALKKLGRILREGDWTVTVVVELDAWDRPDGPPCVIDIMPGEHLESLWAVAIDIGTTSNHVWLVDLISGEVMSQKADYNGQIARGEDVISRIIYASKGQGDRETGRQGDKETGRQGDKEAGRQGDREAGRQGDRETGRQGDRESGLEELQRLVLETLNRLLEEAAKERGIRTDQIYKAVVAGNSTMMHLFVGIPPETIRLMPFVTTINELPPLRAHAVGLNINPVGRVDCLPGVASYVGADITAGVVSSEMCKTGELALFVDIGTNGEMALGDCTWLISCACSAGPAFEGAGVVHGMRATAGAIEEVWVDPETYEAAYRVIGNEKPRGFCGSGLISLLAELFVSGVIDKSGNIDLTLSTEHVREGKHGAEYVVALGDESETGEDIAITAVDIDNLMRAKAAIYAGFSILARSVGLKLADVQHVLIGGAFGQYLNVENAIQIGLLPDKPFDSFHFLGNTSIRGAYLALVSREMRDRVKQVSEMMTYLELSADNAFFDEFNAAMFLPHTDESLFPSTVAGRAAGTS